MTLDELEALLAKSTPGQWESRANGFDDVCVVHDDGRHRYNPLVQVCSSPNESDRLLIAAARNALPDLIKIAKKVAAEGLCYDSCHDGDEWRCALCWGTGDGNREHPETIKHAPDCEWVTARKLAGDQ